MDNSNLNILAETDRENLPLKISLQRSSPITVVASNL